MNSQHQHQHQHHIQIEAIRALTTEIPLNDFGLPTGIYRTDLLPYHDYKPQVPQLTSAPQLTPPDIMSDIMPDSEADLTSLTTQPKANGEVDELDELGEVDVYRIAGFPATALHDAFMPLQFDEGFPAFENGQPFWSRLDYEPTDAFEAFQKYLQMALGRASSLEGVGEDEEYDGQDATGIRNISTLAVQQFPDNQILMMSQIFQEYYHLYYWGMRAHAYDLYRVAQYRTQQETRMIETQDDHYVQSRRLRHRLMQYMNNEEDFWDMMTPKTGLDMLKTITSLERISAGLPATGPMNEATEINRGKPFEVTMRTIAQTNRRVTGKVVTEEGQVLDRALEDPNATEILQELIIRSGGF